MSILIIFILHSDGSRLFAIGPILTSCVVLGTSEGNFPERFERAVALHLSYNGRQNLITVALHSRRRCDAEAEDRSGLRSCESFRLHLILIVWLVGGSTDSPLSWHSACAHAARWHWKRVHQKNIWCQKSIIKTMICYARIRSGSLRRSTSAKY